MNDVGLLTSTLYKNNINAVLEDKTGVNLGAVYETVVAQELKCHGHELYYFDRKKVGEVLVSIKRGILDCLTCSNIPERCIFLFSYLFCETYLAIKRVASVK